MAEAKLRPIRVEGNVAYIPLTQGYTAIIDAADVPLVEGFSWCADVTQNTVYAMRTDHSGAKQRTVRLHRVIMGEPNGLDVDHRDGNGLNNRRHGQTGNLRVASPGQNNCNQRITPRNTSGFKGVYWRKDRAKWQAYIMLNGKQRHLGYFRCPTAAAIAYAKASRELHGEFGRIA